MADLRGSLALGDGGRGEGAVLQREAAQAHVVHIVVGVVQAHELEELLEQPEPASRVARAQDRVAKPSLCCV